MNLFVIFFSQSFHHKLRHKLKIKFPQLYFRREDAEHTDYVNGKFAIQKPCRTF